MNHEQKYRDLCMWIFGVGWLLMFFAASIFGEIHNYFVVGVIAVTGLCLFIYGVKRF